MDKFYNIFPNKGETNNLQYSNTVVHAYRKVPQLKFGYYQKISVMWTQKHDISPPKYFGLIIKTKLKVDTDFYIKNF